MTRGLSRLTLVAGVLGAAAFANSFQLVIVSIGRYQNPSTNTYHYEAPWVGGFFQDASLGAPGSPFTSVVADLTLSATPGAGSGTFTLIGSGSDSLWGQFVGLTETIAPGSISYSGTVNLTGGSGAYAGLVGPGSVSGTDYVRWTVGSDTMGTLEFGAEAVPEPFTLALCACGLGLAAFRRRKAR